MNDHDDNLGDEFDALIERMSDEDNVSVEITEVAEQASLVEIAVPISNFPEPEVVLLRTMAQYLAEGQRRAILAVTLTYQIRSHNLPFLIGAFMLSDPITD